MKQLKRYLTAMMAVVIMICAVPVPAMAAEVAVSSDKITRGKTGKSLSVSFRIRNNTGRDLEDLSIGFDISGGDIWDEDSEDMKYGYSFPFEQTGSLNDTDNPKNIGRLGKDKERTVSLTGQVRRDLSEGYYKVPVVVMDKDGSWLGWEDLRVWISKSTGTDDDDDDENKTYDFVLGEGQSTPRGVYPNVMNFAMNLRNNSPATVYNVKASIVLDSDTTKFPFEINDANYDRMFEKIEKEETVPLDYSFAIRKDAYSGYYPVAMKIFYSTSSTGDELETYEASFYVYVENKEKEDEKGDFNEHDRTKARVIVDGFVTNPQTIIAGEEFDLSLNIKNASTNITATNLLFTFESEKVTDSAVFTTESGSSSIAMDSLGPGATKEIKLRLASKPGIDQRSYGLKVIAKFDSPEFKNAEESMTVDIPIKQIARLNTGTFDIMPESINVGDESNIMFGINNTGKVILYNVMVKFEADSIRTTDAYVGNIKPGETGNVDCMVTGEAPTTDDGIVKVTISYEDENGEVSSEEKELRLYVTEEVMMDDINVGNFEDLPMEKPSFFSQYKNIIIPAGIGAAVVLLIVVTVLVKRHRKKKAARDDEDMDDEIS